MLLMIVYTSAYRESVVRADIRVVFTSPHGFHPYFTGYAVKHV